MDRGFSLRVACALAAKDKQASIPTHALVSFVQEGCTAVVPLQRINETDCMHTLKDGDAVSVLWDNRKKYSATFIMSGSKAECEQEENLRNDEEDGVDNEEDKSCTVEGSSIGDTTQSSSKGGTLTSDKDSTDGSNGGCKKGSGDVQSEEGSKGDVGSSNGSGSGKGGCKKGSSDKQSEDGSKGDIDSSNKSGGSKGGCKKGRRDKQSEDGSKGDVGSSKGSGGSKGGCKKGNSDKQSEDGSKGDGKTNKRKRKQASGKENITTKKRRKNIKGADDDDDSFILKVTDNPSRKKKIPLQSTSNMVSGNESYDHESDLEGWHEYLSESWHNDYPTVSTDEDSENNNSDDDDNVFGATNKEITVVASSPGSVHVSRKSKPIHYTGGKQEKMCHDVKKIFNAITRRIDDESDKQEKFVKEFSSGLDKLVKQFEQSQKTTAVLLAKVLNPHATIPAGFATANNDDNNGAIQAASQPDQCSSSDQGEGETTAIAQSHSSTPLETSLPPKSPVIVSSTPCTSSNTSMQTASPLSQTEIQEMYEKSCSRGNFCLNLVRVLFDTETRIKSNVNGKRGKLRLNPVIIDYIKSVAFQFFPLQSLEDRNKEWANCIIAIDEGAR